MFKLLNSIKVHCESANKDKYFIILKRGKCNVIGVVVPKTSTSDAKSLAVGFSDGHLHDKFVALVLF